MKGVRACVRACVLVCLCVVGWLVGCVGAWVRVGVRACVCVRACVVLVSVRGCGWLAGCVGAWVGGWVGGRREKLANGTPNILLCCDTCPRPYCLACAGIDKVSVRMKGVCVWG